jgi:pyruvate dehydrogenase E2 component (dihydrolipoamide acetyltransferase)
MAISVVMPALEMAQETGKLLSWRKKEGDTVKKGEPLLEIETDKAVVEIEAPGDGILAGVTAHEGAVIPVGETIAWLVKAGEKPPGQKAASAPSARAISAAMGSSGAAATRAAAVTASATSSSQISPKARRLAKELGVDISRLTGRGPDGTITAEDVQAAADSASSSSSSAVATGTPSPSEPTSALSQIARLMAERTTQSWTSVPHFFLTRDVDCTQLLATHKRLGAALEKSGGGKVTVTDLLVALVARALAKHPVMNSSWSAAGIKQNGEINISVAMAVKDGVVGAVIPKADKAKLTEISKQRAELTERARANRLRPADISGGTFTISNLGMYKVDAFVAIITPPQAATLAVGAIGDRVVPVKGKPGIRPVMNITLSSDHRVVDGARAAEFLSTVADAIQNADGWLA